MPPQLDQNSAPEQRVLSQLRSATHLPSLLLLAVVATALIGGGYALVSTLSAERALREQVRTTSAILADLRDVQSAAIGAETGQRGYVITGEARYLAPYERGRSRLPVALDSLDSTLGPVATPAQAQSLERLRAASEAKLAELAQTVELVQSGNRAAAIEIVETDEGLELMEEIRSIVSELEAFEEDIQSTALSNAEKAEQRAFPILLFLSIALIIALTLGLWQTVRSARAESQVRNLAEIKRAQEQADLLARELNHRVKNLFAVVSSIAGTTIRNESDNKVAAEKVQRRIRALAIAHEVSQGTHDQPIVRLEELIEATMAPHAEHQDRLSMRGDPITISPDAVTPIGLLLHELATNAVKYGAWSDANGKIAIEWKREPGEDGSRDDDDDSNGDWAILRWSESEGPGPEQQITEGFGTRMMKLAASQLGGQIRYLWLDTGLEVNITFPIPQQLSGK